MDQKSVMILKKLEEIFRREDILAADFPKKEVTELIHEENQIWLDDLSQKIERYEFLYSELITLAIRNGEKDELIRIMGEIIHNSEKTPVELCDEMNSLNETRLTKELQIEGWKEYAHNAYCKYQFHDASGENVFKGKGVVYTVITGGYDTLKEPWIIDRDYDYICYTDNKNLVSDVWTIRYIENEEGLDNTRLARKYKVLCHEFLKEYDYSVYVDGKMQIVGNLREMIERYSKGSPMLCFPHYERECAYEEAEAFIKYREGKDKETGMIREQMKQYEAEGYSKNNGLIDTACLVRLHHNKELQKVLISWWNEIKNRSRRDQLSVGYACWKNNFHYDLVDLFIYYNDYLIGLDHS